MQHAVSMLSVHGQHMASTRPVRSQHMVSMHSPCGLHAISAWLAHGQHAPAYSQHLNIKKNHSSVKFAVGGTSWDYNTHHDKIC